MRDNGIRGAFTPMTGQVTGVQLKSKNYARCSDLGPKTIIILELNLGHECQIPHPFTMIPIEESSIAGLVAIV